MKRITLLLVGLLSLPFFSYSGGIVHNTNQSASWVRNFARDASTSIDAVFYNPAGLTKLDDGFYISINNQYLQQNRTITSDYMYLAGTPTDFEGGITAPLFPGVYAAYKTGKFAISFGWNPIGGGGGATFENGLPAFELPVSDLVPSLAAQGATAYSLDAFFEGGSVFWGYQLGVSYEINDMISVAVGARYVSAKNTYEGHLKDVMITMGGTDVPAATFFANTATAIQPLYDGLNGLSAAGAGGFTLDQVYAGGAGTMTLAEYTALAGGYAMFGLDPATHTIDQGSAAVTPQYLGARRAEHVLADQEGVDVEQTATGITPIISVNFSPNDKLNVAVKYEFKTELEFENETKTDFIIDYDFLTDTETGMFPDGEKFNNDLPAFLSVGADYKITDKFSVAAGLHYYFDKSADYNRKVDGVVVKNEDVIDNNFYEIALGLEYQISEKMLISGGFLMARTGVSPEYQTDLSHSISSNSFGIGGGYAISPAIDLNIGVAYTTYSVGEKDYQHDLGGSGMMIDLTESYDRSNFFVGLGLDFKLGGKSE